MAKTSFERRWSLADRLVAFRRSRVSSLFEVTLEEVAGSSGSGLRSNDTDWMSNSL